MRALWAFFVRGPAKRVMDRGYVSPRRRCASPSWCWI